MRSWFVLPLLLALTLGTAHAGDEVGGNGDAVAAYFASSAFALQQALAGKEREGRVYLPEFTAETFLGLLNTPVLSVSPGNEDLLRNELGEVMDVKVIFDTTAKPKIHIRGALWNRYLEAKKPDYRMILHAYIYAAGLDDRAYQFSGRVPIESLGLPTQTPEDPIQEFEIPIGMHKLHYSPRQGLYGVSADKTKILVFNVNGLLMWEFAIPGKTFVDVSTWNDDFYTFVEGTSEVIRFRKDGKWGLTGCTAKDVVAARHFLILTKTELLEIDRNFRTCEARWKIPSDVQVTGLSSAENYIGAIWVYGAKVVAPGPEGTYPFMYELGKSKPEGDVNPDVRGTITAAVANSREHDSTKVVVGSLWRHSDASNGASPFFGYFFEDRSRKTQFSQFKGFKNSNAAAKDVAWYDDFVWILTDDNKLYLERLDTRSHQEEPSIVQDFGAANVRNVIALNSSHIVVATDQAIKKYAPPVGLDWKRNFTAQGENLRPHPAAQQSCLEAVSKEIATQDALCKREQGVGYRSDYKCEKCQAIYVGDSRGDGNTYICRDEFWVECRSK